MYTHIHGRVLASAEQVSEGGMIPFGNPHRAQFVQFELFLLLKLDRQFPVEQFEATVSQSTVPCPPLKVSVWARFGIAIDDFGIPPSAAPPATPALLGQRSVYL